MQLLSSLLVVDVLLIQLSKLPRQVQLQGSILLFAISELVVKELGFVNQYFLFKVKILDQPLLAVTLFPYLHALCLNSPYLGVKVCQFSVLNSFKLCFACLLLKHHELILDLEHVEPIGHEEVLLVVLQHHVELVVKVFDSFIDASVDVSNALMNLVYVSCTMTSWSLAYSSNLSKLSVQQ